MNDIMYIGGEFKGTLSIPGADSLNHICSVYLPDHLGEKPISKVKEVSVYPNPASTSVKIEAYIGEGSFSIFSTNGQELMRGKLREGGQEINIESLASGQYILEMEIGRQPYFEKTYDLLGFEMALVLNI